MLKTHRATDTFHPLKYVLCETLLQASPNRLWDENIYFPTTQSSLTLCNILISNVNKQEMGISPDLYLKHV